MTTEEVTSVRLKLRSVLKLIIFRLIGGLTRSALRSSIAEICQKIVKEAGIQETHPVSKVISVPYVNNAIFIT